MQNLTPYAAAKVTNIILASKGIDRSISPQMMYSYAKNNRIATVPNSKPVLFDGDAFKQWLDKYIEGGATTGKVNFQALATEFVTEEPFVEDPEFVE